MTRGGLAILVVCVLWMQPACADEALNKAGGGTTQGKSMRHFKLNERIVLTPSEAAEGPDGLVVKLLGYGHKIPFKGPDEPFLELEVRQGPDSTVLRQSVPIAQAQTREWRGWTFTFLLCKEDGPPHSAVEPLELVIGRK
jgi:hypothetical protein